MGARRADVLLAADVDELVDDLAATGCAEPSRPEAQNLQPMAQPTWVEMADGLRASSLADAELRGADDDGLDEGLVASSSRSCR